MTSDLGDSAVGEVALPGARASDAPVRVTGTRARSGNAMARTRAAILNAAQHSIERSGVKRTSMSEVATTAGVAKATLYNHFRTKEDVLAALVETRVTELADQAAGIAAGTAPQVPGQPDRGEGLAAALIFVTDALAGSLALRRLAVDEPAVLMRLAAPTVADGWPVARRAASQVLVAAGLEAAPVTADLVLRHLVQHLVWPSTAEDSRIGAQLLERGLRALRPAPAAPTGPEAAAMAEAAAVAAPQGDTAAAQPPVPTPVSHAVGWPG